MSKSGKDKVRVAAELVSMGATMMSEPCPECGGIQVRYRGKVYCTNHEDLSSVITSEVLSFETVTAKMKEVLLVKLNETAESLGSEKDGSKQEQLISLMTKYFDLLDKLPQK